MTDQRPSQDPRYSRLPDRRERTERSIIDILQTHLGDYRRDPHEAERELRDEPPTVGTRTEVEG